MANAYPDFAPIVQNQVLPATKDLFMQASNHCFNDDVKIFAFQDMYKYLKAGPGVIDLPDDRRIFGEGATMGTHGTPNFPLFVYKGVYDEISSIADTDALVDKFYGQGVAIEYIRDDFGEHFVQAVTSVGDVLNFIEDRFDGKPISDCGIRNETLDALDSLPTFASFAGAYIGDLAGLLGRPLELIEIADLLGS